MTTCDNIYVPLPPRNEDELNKTAMNAVLVDVGGRCELTKMQLLEGIAFQRVMAITRTGRTMSRRKMSDSEQASMLYMYQCAYQLWLIKVTSQGVDGVRVA